MLHATCHHGKSSLYKRYLGYRDNREKMVHEEDEITSIVIGPLDFLLPEEVHFFWHSVLNKLSAPTFESLGIPQSVVIKFWDSRKSNDRIGRIEPDSRVDFYWADGARRILLLEFKWRAPLSGDNQLHRQWLQYLSQDEKEDALHLFIAPEVSAGASAKQIQAGDVWGNKLVLVSWMQIRNVLGEIKIQHPGGLGRWAKVADGFLERVGIRKFTGFSFANGNFPHLQDVSVPLFWKPFRGISDVISLLPKLPQSITEPIFFNKRHNENLK